MSLIVTPRQLAIRAELYHQLGAMVAAGLPLPKVIEMLIKSPPARSLRPGLKKILAGLKEGNSFSESLRQAKLLPSFDVSLLEAGETSGRMDACFQLLSNYYNGRAELARNVISDLGYPMFVLHFAIFIMPLPQLVSGNVDSYLAQTLGVLIPAYAVLVLLAIACQGQRGEFWRSIVEQFGNLVPIWGTARRHLALARLSVALEALINAGVSIFNAWELAAAASGSPAIRREVLSWREQLESGEKTPSDLLSESSEFPEMYANLYHSGEISGQQDETLKRLYNYYQDDGTRKMRALSKWVPKIVFLLIAIRIGYFIITFYAGYFKSLQQVME